MWVEPQGCESFIVEYWSIKQMIINIS
jgi:hypothetical protein